MRSLVMGLMTGSMALSAAPAKAADEMTIAVFTKNQTNPAYEAFRIAADRIAQATGVRVVHFVPKQPDNVDEQKAMVEQVLKDKPDVVIFIPVDDVAMIPSVKELNSANIPVVLVANPLPGSFVTYVGADDYEIGYRQAHYLFDSLGGKGNYQQPDAKRAMEKFLAAYPQIDAVLSANDGMALGALEALKEAGRTSVVIGVNGILPAVKQIETGAILASVDFNMFKIGCTATRAAVRYLKREPLPEKVIL